MLLALVSLGVAHGQQAGGAAGGFDAHGFQLAPHDGDLRDPLVVQRPGSLVAGDWFASGLVEYAKAPLVQVVVPDGGGPEEALPLVDNLVALNVSAGVALHERIRLDVKAPVYGVSTGTDLQAQPPAMGDLRLGATVLGVAPAHVVGGGGPGFGVFAHVDVPTGNTDRFLGQGKLAGGLGVAGTVELPTTTLTAHVGTQFNPTADLANVQGSDRVVAGLAAGFITSDTVAVNLEGVIQPSVSAADPDLRFTTLPPSEAILSLRVLPENGSFWTVGAAGGLTDGPGVAAFRLFVGGGFADRTPLYPIDRDTIGSLRTTDACPGEPETVNDWRDDDGCPDRLGALSVEARFAGTPRAVEAEVVGPDGRQTVTVPATGWQVDAIPGSSFQVRAWDGCLQGEGSAVIGEGGSALSIALAPVLDAKVTIEVVGPDDAPIPGATARWVSPRPECAPKGELVADARGIVPNELAAGTHHLVVTAVGYTLSEQDVELLKGDDRVLRIQLGASRVVFEKKQIRILEKVQFETAKAVIRSESFGLLDEVAKVIKDHPDVGRVEVAGHTDDRGSDTYNQKLSDDRAKSVMKYLIEKAGVDPARLLAVGYGETRPIATNRTDAGRESNRRVEFNLVDQVGVDPVDPQQEKTP
jgi:outer membrane protein OmpA-like peptidoglycan-associated protein